MVYFSAYAEMKGYNCQEIGDIETVAAFLKEGHPVIISNRAISLQLVTLW